MTDATNNDPLAQIAHLREQVETLIREKAAPALDSLRHKAEEAGHDTRAASQEQIHALAEAVRARPLAAVLIAAATGFLLGRASR